MALLMLLRRLGDKSARGFSVRSTPSGAWVALVPLMLALPPAGAQLTPDPPTKAYFGINRPIAVAVRVPDTASGEVRIDLFEPGREQAIATAPIPPDPATGTASLKADLALLFPVLWSGPLPKLRYAQLVVGGQQVGPPIVLQPMVSEQRAKLVDPKSRQVWFRDPLSMRENFSSRDASVEWVTEPPTYSGLRVYVDQLVTLDTTEGQIVVRLRPDEAPNTCWNFRELVRLGFFDQILVHRVVPKLPSGHPFVVQMGDPTGTGDGGPGYSIDLENSAVRHDFGILSMARAEDPDTGSSQFFIALSREGTQRLDGKYTAFGEAITGAETIMNLSRVPVKGDRPNDPPVLRTAGLIDAPPYDQRPARVQRPEEQRAR